MRIGVSHGKIRANSGGRLAAVVRSPAGRLRQQRKRRTDHRCHAAPGEVPALSNEDPLARPVAVAWTSARAQRCGFYFDPTKLRASYLAYEAKQSNRGATGKSGEELRLDLQGHSRSGLQRPDYCTDRKGTEIKTELAASPGWRFYSQASANQEGRDVWNVGLPAGGLGRTLRCKENVRGAGQEAEQIASAARTRHAWMPADPIATGPDCARRLSTA